MQKPGVGNSSSLTKAPNIFSDAHFFLHGIAFLRLLLKDFILPPVHLARRGSGWESSPFFSRHGSVKNLCLRFCLQEMVLTDLQAETTYSVAVAAYTTKGDGARSKPKLVSTTGAGKLITLYSLMYRAVPYVSDHQKCTAAICKRVKLHVLQHKTDLCPRAIRCENS